MSDKLEVEGNKRKIWLVKCRLSGTLRSVTIHGDLYTCKSHYKLHDTIGDKKWFFPIGKTIIEQV